MKNRNKINSDQLPGSTSQGKIKTVIQTLPLEKEWIISGTDIGSNSFYVH